MRRVSPLLFVAAVLVLEPFAEHGMALLGRSRSALPCTCIGPEAAEMSVVYLHGLDTFGPSWTEIRNRQKLRAIAEILHARIALPRASGRWPRGAAIGDSVGLVREAAMECLGQRKPVLVGFSDGANVTNELFLECRTDVASWFIAAGGSEGAVRPSVSSLSACGQLRLLAGRHEPGLERARAFARQLLKRGADVSLSEHPGPHELPFPGTLAALEEARARDGL